MSEQAADREAPKRLRAADVIETLQAALHEALTRREAEPWVTVEVADAAKGEVRVETKVSAPLGCDMQWLKEHARRVTAIAVAEHTNNGARRGPLEEDRPKPHPAGMKRPV